MGQLNIPAMRIAVIENFLRDRFNLKISLREESINTLMQLIGQPNSDHINNNNSNTGNHMDKRRRILRSMNLSVEKRKEFIELVMESFAEFYHIREFRCNLTENPEMTYKNEETEKPSSTGARRSTGACRSTRFDSAYMKQYGWRKITKEMEMAKDFLIGSRGSLPFDGEGIHLPQSSILSYRDKIKQLEIFESIQK